MSQLNRPEPLFFHFRARNSQGEIAPKGGATIVFHPTEKKFAVALCCPKDRFCKRTGAKIAMHRLGINVQKGCQSRRFDYVISYMGDNEFKDVKASATLIARHAAASVDNQEVLSVV